VSFGTGEAVGLLTTATGCAVDAFELPPLEAPAPIAVPITNAAAKWTMRFRVHGGADVRCG
jgi:hypothetical protein